MTDTLTAHSREWPLRRFQTTDSHGREIDVFLLSDADRAEKETLDKETMKHALPSA